MRNADGNSMSDECASAHDDIKRYSHAECGVKTDTTGKSGSRVFKSHPWHYYSKFGLAAAPRENPTVFAFYRLNISSLSNEVIRFILLIPLP